MSGTDQNREQGVEFGDLSEKLRSEEYPVEKRALLEKYGDETLELSDERVTFADVVGPLGEEEFDSYGAVEGAVMNMVGDEAIGRKNYSDRTPPAPGEEREDEGAPGQEVDDEQESF